jgi:Ser-tRNA(Ala) deacylase AlaX
MPTDCLFREDSYLKDCEATVVGIEANGGIVLDRTVFYAASGGQPADKGSIVTKSGETIPIANVVFTDPGKTTIAHVPAPGARPSRSATRSRPRSTGRSATPGCACTRRCICSPRCCPIR